jgi:hypothetical protein
VHTWATYALIPLIGGHVLVASGMLPGYRGVWRSMHLGGRLDVEVARRLWPEWRAPSRACLASKSVAAYVIGALEPDERATMRRHLRRCAACRAEAADLAKVADMLTQCPPAETG